MSEFVVAVMAILALIWAFFWVKRTLSKQESRKKDYKLPEPLMQAEQNKPVNNSVSEIAPNKELEAQAESQEKESSCSTESNSGLIVESQIHATDASVQQASDEGIPQDFILRRHYLTNLNAIAESPEITRPVEPLICDYESSVVPCETPKLPEDSMLRRHAITKLYTTVASNMPLHPTDSALRRHYDTIINAEINKILGCKVV